jgi:cell division initiation protein
MVMTPLELDKRDFKRAVRGYSEEEVEYYISVVRTDYEILYTENQELKVRLDDYELNIGKYKALEHTLNNTLIVAQQTAEELKRNAEKAAELILEEAKLKAQQRIHEAEAEIRKLSMQREDLLKRIIELKVRLRVFLRAQLELLDRTIEEEEDFLPKTSAKASREVAEKPLPQIMKQESAEAPNPQPTPQIFKEDLFAQETPQIIKPDIVKETVKPVEPVAQEEPIMAPEPETTEQQVPEILKKEAVVNTVINPFEQVARPFVQEESVNMTHHNEEVATQIESTHAEDVKVVEELLQNREEDVEDEVITARSLLNKAKKWVKRNKS